MTVTCTTGRRKSDRIAMFDFHRYRGILRANTKYIEGGIPLEEIEPGHTSLILVHRDWDKMYFLNGRIGWTDEDYFRWAAQRMKDIGIANP